MKFSKPLRKEVRLTGHLAAAALVLLWLCGAALADAAADASYSDQLDSLIPTPVVMNAAPKIRPDLAAFESTLTNQVRAMAQGPELPEEPLPNTSVAWACVGAAALALGMRFLGPRAVIRFTREGQALVSLALRPETVRAEEKSFAAFAATFKVAPGK